MLIKLYCRQGPIKQTAALNSPCQRGSKIHPHDSGYIEIMGDYNEGNCETWGMWWDSKYYSVRRHVSFPNVLLINLNYFAIGGIFQLVKNNGRDDRNQIPSKAPHIQGKSGNTVANLPHEPGV